MVLRVILQVVPHGDEEKAREIGRLDIFNKGQVGSHCDFQGTLCEYGVLDLSPGQEGLHQDTIYHTREDGAWELVRSAIKTLEIKGP